MQRGEGVGVSLQLQACDVLDRGRKERGVRSGGSFICRRQARGTERLREGAGRLANVVGGRWRSDHIGGLALEVASRCIT